MRFQHEEVVKLSDKYAIRFGAWVGIPGSETMISEMITDFVYGSEDEALTASNYLLDDYSVSGNFLNTREKI